MNNLVYDKLLNLFNNSNWKKNDTKSLNSILL